MNQKNHEKIDAIDLKHQINISIFIDFRYRLLEIYHLLNTDFYRLTTPGYNSELEHAASTGVRIS